MKKHRPATAGPMFVDRFDCGLPDLPKVAQADQESVLRHIIGSGGRFSCFEASANRTIAKTVTALCRSAREGRLRGFVEVDSLNSVYPWTTVRLTTAGRIVYPELAKLEAGRRALSEGGA